MNPTPTPTRFRCRGGGFALVCGLVVMVALTALGSLAADYGHAQLAKLQVQRAADMAARAAAYQSRFVEVKPAAKPPTVTMDS